MTNSTPTPFQRRDDRYNATSNVFAWALIALLAVGAWFGHGCATRDGQVPRSAVSAAHDTLSTARDSARTALLLWAVYVANERERIASLPVAERFEPNNALLKQEGRVKAATLRFNIVFAAAEAPLRAAIKDGHDPLAPAGVLATLSELVNLINAFRN